MKENEGEETPDSEIYEIYTGLVKLFKIRDSDKRNLIGFRRFSSQF